MLNIFIIFLFFLLLMSPILKSENIKLTNFTFAENKLPESRLLIDSQTINKEKKVQIKKKNDVEIKSETKKIKSIKKSELKKSYKLIINFLPEEDKPTEEEIRIFYDNIVKLSKESSIIIKAYAQKRENDSTSKVRRLSLKRALFLRSLLLKEKYNIYQIYVKALGYDNELEGNKDIVIITNN